MGRLAQNDISFIWDGTASSKHGILKLNEDGDVVYIDTKSTNGSWSLLTYAWKLALDDESELRFGMNEIFRIKKYS